MPVVPGHFVSDQRRRYYSYKSVQEGNPHRPVFELREQSPPGAQGKRGVVRALTCRARSIVSDLGERKKELEHVREALGYNGVRSTVVERRLTCGCMQVRVPPAPTIVRS